MATLTAAQLSEREVGRQRSRVAVLKTTPESVIDDYGRLMRLLNYTSVLPRDRSTILKINISWHYFFPACSTTPWQLEGVIKTMIEDGYKPKSLVAAQNRTVVVNPEVGAIANKHNPVLQKYGVRTVWLYKSSVEWVVYQPKGKMLVLDKIFRDGITIPKFFIGMNAIHLPTLKTHVFTTTTGAMKNAFGGLLKENRHWCHANIHESLVDLLAIQKEIHPGLFAVMDGTFAGNGAGPRAMKPVVANLILASDDMVAIDAVAAKLMGFDPLSIGYIRLGHELGLGCGDVREIEIVGDDVSDVNLGFSVGDTFASKGQKAIYWGPLKPLERFLLRSPIVPWSYLASRLYYDIYWYHFVGVKRVREMINTDWGRLFMRYGR